MKVIITETRSTVVTIFSTEEDQEVLDFVRENYNDGSYDDKVFKVSKVDVELV